MGHFLFVGLLQPVLGFRPVFLGEEATPGGFPLFSGKVRIVSQTLSGLFLVGALVIPFDRKLLHN